MKISENSTNIFSALAEFQGEITNPPRSANNPFFKSKYTPLDSMIDHVRPLLYKHDLSVIQFPCSDSDGVGVVTLICHKNGEFIESDPYYLKTAKSDPQAGGSAITYARRYALAAALGIASDTDDDGNAASENKTKEPKEAAPIKCRCAVCRKEMPRSTFEKSLAKYGQPYCSGECKEKDNETSGV